MLAARRTRFACWRIPALVLALLGGAAGCTPPPPPAPSQSGAEVTSPPARSPSGVAVTSPRSTGSSATADRTVPAGAIAVGPDLFQVPIGTDAEGCPMYRLHAPGRMVTQAIAWRRPDGSFTLDRREAACAR